VESCESRPVEESAEDNVWLRSSVPFGEAVVHRAAAVGGTTCGALGRLCRICGGMFSLSFERFDQPLLNLYFSAGKCQPVVRSTVDNKLDSTVIIDLLTWALVCFGEHVFGVIMLASQSIVVF